MWKIFQYPKNILILEVLKCGSIWMSLNFEQIRCWRNRKGRVCPVFYRPVPFCLFKQNVEGMYGAFNRDLYTYNYWGHGKLFLYNGIVLAFLEFHRIP